MSKYIKCNDYFIVKIQYYVYNQSNIVKLYKRAQLSNEFFCNLFEKVSGRSVYDFQLEYQINTFVCIEEELENDYGILRLNFFEGYYVYLIPKNYIEIINWVVLNIQQLPYKILKKTKTGFREISTKNNFERTQSNKFTQEYKQLILIRESTRNTLFEKYIKFTSTEDVL